MDGYDDLYGDLYVRLSLHSTRPSTLKKLTLNSGKKGDEEEQQQAQPAATTTTTTTSSEPTADTKQPSAVVSSPSGGSGVVKTEPISSLLAHEDQLQQQKHQALAQAQAQQQAAQMTGSNQAVGEPLHFSPGYAQQRQQEGKTGGVRPNDMPDEG
ncbi:hypothetical protein JCM5350_005557 [Sporobolomyces pararoseus]